MPWGANELGSLHPSSRVFDDLDGPNGELLLVYLVDCQPKSRILLPKSADMMIGSAYLFVKRNELGVAPEDVVARSIRHFHSNHIGLGSIKADKVVSHDQYRRVGRFGRYDDKIELRRKGAHFSYCKRS
jgi:hypothetical protein